MVPVIFYCLWVGKDWWFLDPINTFWIAYLLFGVVQPCTFRTGWIDVYGIKTVLMTLGMFLLAGCSVCAGYRMDLGRRLGMKLPLPRGQDDVRRLIALGISAVVLGSTVYVYVISSSGGIAFFLSKSRTNINYDQVSISMLTLLPLVPLGLLILLCTCYATNSRLIARHIALGATVMWGVWCVYSGTRSGLITTAVIIVGALFGSERRNPSIWVGIFAVLAVVTLVGFTTAYRGALYGARFNSNDTFTEALDNSLNSYTQQQGELPPMGAEFSIAQAVVQNVPEQVPYNLGRMLLEILTRPIPRSLWPDKVYPEGEAWDHIHRIAGTAGWVNNVGYMAGPAPSFVGKYYYMGGIVGVMFGGLWTGIFLNAARTYIRLYPPAAQMLLAVGCAQLGFSEMNNPLSLVFGWLPSIGAALALIILLSRKPHQSTKRRFQTIRFSAARTHSAHRITR